MYCTVTILGKCLYGMDTVCPVHIPIAMGMRRQEMAMATRCRHLILAVTTLLRFIYKFAFSP